MPLFGPTVYTPLGTLFVEAELLLTGVGQRIPILLRRPPDPLGSQLPNPRFSPSSDRVSEWMRLLTRPWQLTGASLAAGACASPGGPPGGS